MKKDFNKSKYGLSVGVALLLSQFAAFGGDLFDNNLLKVDLNKTSPAGVKVTLYTKNPYKEALTVNKKSDFQYVILLPETVSSITSKPSLSATSDVIQNIEVKTQQLSQEASKGYTKIIISTTKPIEIVAQNQVLSTSDYKVSESDYKELIAQAGKKSVAQKSAVSAAKKAEPVKKATTPAKKSTVQPAKTAKPVIKKQAIPVAKPKPKVAAPAVQKPVNKPPVQKSVEQKPVVQPAKNIPATTPAPVTTTAPAPQPQTAPATTPTAEQALPAAQPIPAMPQKVEMPLPETPFQKVMNIIKANLTMFAGGALLIPLILLLIFMKKGKKPVAEIKEEKTQVQETSEGMPNIQQLQEEVVEEEVIEEGLTEDELPETEEIIFPQEEIITDKKEEIDTLFNQDTANDILTKEHQKQAEDVEENTEREPVIETVPETSSPAEESFEEILPLEDIIPLENIEPIDEIEQMEGAVAPEPESELESETETETETDVKPEQETLIEVEETSVENPVEQEEIIEEKQEEVHETTDLEDFLEGKEEVQEIEEIIEPQVQEAAFEEVDLETLSFEETLPSIQQQDEESTTFEPLASLEELTEEAEKIEQAEQIQEVEDLSALEKATIEEIPSTISLDEFEVEEEPKTVKKEEELIEDLFEAEEEPLVEEETVDEEEIERKENEILLNSLGLKSRSEFAVDCEKGFHLVDFEGTTALIGYINDEIFVLKRFDETIKSPLQVRLSERKADKEDYMVKAGSFKAIIEVSPYNMELVIEL